MLCTHYSIKQSIRLGPSTVDQKECSLLFLPLLHLVSHFSVFGLCCLWILFAIISFYNMWIPPKSFSLGSLWVSLPLASNISAMLPVAPKWGSCIFWLVLKLPCDFQLPHNVPRKESKKGLLLFILPQLQIGVHCLKIKRTQQFWRFSTHVLVLYGPCLFYCALLKWQTG